MISKAWKVTAIISLIMLAFSVILIFSLSITLFEYMSTPAGLVSVTKSEHEMADVLLRSFGEKTKSLDFTQYVQSVGTSKDERLIGTVAMTHILATTVRYELPLYKIRKSSIKFDDVNKELIVEMPDLIETIEEDESNSHLVKATSSINFTMGGEEYEREALNNAKENQNSNILKIREIAKEGFKSQLEMIITVFFQGFGKDITVKCYYR
jgi:hypothetical protein